MKKRISYCAGFLTILALFLGVLSLVLVPKKRDWDHGLHNARIWAFQAEPENSLDVLSIGDSLLMCGYSPVDLWQQTGITGFNACTGNQRLTLSLRLLEAFSRSQSPQVVLLEADSLYLTIETDDLFQDRLGAWIPVLEYHDNWKRFSREDFLIKPEYTFSPISKGTHFLYDQNPELPENLDTYMDDYGRTAPIGTVNRFYFSRIAALCEKKGIRLVLVSVPCPSLWNLARHNAVSALAEEYGLDYLDLNQEPGLIDWSTDKSTEGDHLNNLGCRKVTKALAAYLEPFLSPSHSEAVSQAWASASEALNAAVSEHTIPEKETHS